MTKATKKTPAKATAKSTKAPAAKAKANPAAKSPDLNKVSKSHIVDIISTTNTISKKDSATLFDATIEVITEALKQGKAVGLPGLGTLTVKATAARNGVNPGTAEKIVIPAGKKVAYKVALDLKKTL